MSTVEMEVVLPSFSMPSRPIRSPLQWISDGIDSLHGYRTVVIAVAMLGIGFVSAYDFYLTISTISVLPEMEQNVLGRKIMGLDSDEILRERVAAFLGLKFAGNVVVLVIIGVMGMLGSRRIVPVSLGVLAFQLWLLYHLCRPGFSVYYDNYIG